MAIAAAVQLVDMRAILAPQTVNYDRAAPFPPVSGGITKL
jgi:hypothetical protein